MNLCLQILLIFGLLRLNGCCDKAINSLLGKGVYVPKVDLLGSISEQAFGAAQVFKEFKRSCYSEHKAYHAGQSQSYYKDTEAFYSSTAISTNIDSSLTSTFTLGTTLKIQSKNIAGSKNTITGEELVILASSKSFSLDKTCLVTGEPFVQGFLNDLRHLPTKIVYPALKSSWNSYDVFLHKYGSHVLIQITTGSEFNARSFSEHSEKYSKRDFTVKSCLTLAGPVPVGLIGVDACLNVSKEEESKVKRLRMTSTLNVNGGTSATRNKVAIGPRTKELLKEFLDEANQTEAAIRYQLYSISDIIAEYSLGESHDDLLRSVNMKAYYDGYLSYGCSLQQSGGQDLQRFEFTKFSTPKFPGYQCSLATEGCHGDKDCKYHPFSCACQGISCVIYNTTTLPNDKQKVTAFINLDKNLGSHGCHWSFKCKCKNIHIERKIVWKSDEARNRLAYKAHRKLKIVNKY